VAAEPNADTGLTGSGPWRLALRRLRRNRVALSALGLFAAIVVFVLAAPLWADDVAHTGPNTTHTLEKVEVDGEKRDVVDPEGQPIGPLWFSAGG
jgi:peptide/nickel transport system permease protein